MGAVGDVDRRRGGGRRSRPGSEVQRRESGEAQRDGDRQRDQYGPTAMGDAAVLGGMPAWCSQDGFPSVVRRRAGGRVDPLPFRDHGREAKTSHGDCGTSHDLRVKPP
jgi:hypothetical protein